VANAASLGERPWLLDIKPLAWRVARAPRVRPSKWSPGPFRSREREPGLALLTPQNSSR